MLIRRDCRPGKSGVVRESCIRLPFLCTDVYGFFLYIFHAKPILPNEMGLGFV